MIKDRMSLEEKEEYDMMMAMRFRNEEEGFGFYNKYAKGKGFSVRKDYTRRDSSTKMVFHRRYTCSRQGYRKDMYMDVCNRSRQPRALTRCGCEAQFEIKHDKRTGEWYVLKFVGRHNHELCKPDEVAFLRSHRGLIDAQKAKVIELKDVGLRQCQVMDVMERDHGGFEAAGFVTRDLYNYFVRQKKKQIEGGDADRVIKYMQARQKDDMEFFFFGYETDQMERYRLLRAFGSEVFFKASLSEDVTLEVMNLLENLSIDIEGCETVHKDEVEYGHVVGQSMRSDIANGDKVLDPTDVVPKGAPTKRMRGFLEKRARRCGYCRHPGHTIRSCPIYLRKAAVDV